MKPWIGAMDFRRTTIALIAFVMGCGQTPGPPAPPATPKDRISLERLIADEEVESVHAVANFVPTIKSQIDDLDSSVVDLLRSLPGVAQVEVLVECERPTHRIIHLRDWHFVPKNDYTIDMNEVYGRKLSEGKFDWHLLGVDLVQIEQMTVLRCLIKNHGLKRVFAEGFSPEQIDAYRERIAFLKKMEDENIPRIRSQLKEVRKLMKDGADEKTQVIKRQLENMLEDHKQRLLELGAAGRLLISGELEEVLPLEEREALDEASPISANGLKVASEKMEARHDAQVLRATKEGAVAVIVLGGAHDLSASVRRVSENCEYLRMTTKRIRELGE